MLSEILSGVLGAIIGAAVSFLTLRYNYRDLYARSISKNRMDWINNFREEVSIIIATLKTSATKNQKDIGINYLFNAEKARTKLLTRLNMDISKTGNEYNKVMADMLAEIDFSLPCQSIDHYMERLIDLSRKILEPEWRRVKQEAGGDKK